MENGQPETVSLGDYVGVLRRRKWIIVLVTLLVTLAAVLFSQRQQTLYSATSEVSRTVVPLPGATQPPTKGNPGEWAQAQADVLGSTLTIGDAVAKDLNKQHKDAGLTGQDVLDDCTAQPSQNADTIQFACKSSAALAGDMADAYANEFRTIYLAQTTGALSAAISRTNDDIAKLDKRIARDDARGNLTQKVSDTNRKSKLVAQLAALQVARTVNNGEQVSVRTAQKSQKVQPYPTRNGLIGLAIGLVLGLILAFIQDVLDTRVRTAGEIGQRLRLPMLARVPEPSRDVRRSGLPALLTENTRGRAAQAEAYRILKLNLEFATRGQHVKTIAVTSAIEREGVSTTAANLAIALARSGKHVVLVDGNLRRPQQSRFFGIDGRQGLTELLAGTAKLDAALAIVDIHRVNASMGLEPRRNGHSAANGLLEVLPAGVPVSDPAELLDSRLMTELIDALRRRADVVVIDAPALLPVTDAMVLATKVDGVLVVTRPRLLHRTAMVGLRRALSVCPALKLGFVFAGGPVGGGNDYGGHYAPAEQQGTLAGTRPMLEPVREPQEAERL